MSSPHSHSHGHGHDHDHDHDHNHSHPPPQTSPPKEECRSCEDGEGCRSNPTPTQGAIPRGIAANLAKIDIFTAVETGDLPLVHYIATKAAPMSLRAMDQEGNTVLHAAARKNHVDVALYLIEQGIPIDIPNSMGHTPLMMALSFGHIAVTSALLKLGADPNKKDNLGFSPVIHAAQFGSVFSFHHLISNAPVDINDLDNDKHSVLCWACYSGHKDLVEYLVSEHCPQIPHLGVLDSMHRTPMHWAASANYPDVCTLLVKYRCKLCAGAVDGADIEKNDSCPTGRQMLDIRDEEGKTPADVAKVKGHTDTAQMLEFERTGMKNNAEPPLKKAESERLPEFLSSFLPFIFIIFFGLPILPPLGVLILAAAVMSVHFSGRIKWSNKGRTWVPAGFLLGSLVGMFYGVLSMGLPKSTVFLMLIGEVVCYYSYYTLLFADPGKIHPSNSYFKMALDVAAGGTEPSKEYCRECRVIKPPRSKHCRECGICTDRFDHHCLWISNCVAKRNHRRFYVMVFQCTYMMAFYIWLGITFMRTQVNMEVKDGGIWASLAYLTHYHAVVFWMTAFFLLAVFPMGSLWVFHTSFIARDVTTYEMMTKFRNNPGGSPKPHSILRLINFLRGSFHSMPITTSDV